MPVTSGDQYTYNGPQMGNQPDSALLPGTVVTVREVVEAAEVGAHDSNEDCVVIEWETAGTVVLDTRLEAYSEPVVQAGDNGFPLLDDSGGVRIELATRTRVVPVLGQGTVSRAVSIGMSTFTSEFQAV